MNLVHTHKGGHSWEFIIFILLLLIAVVIDGLLGEFRRRRK